MCVSLCVCVGLAEPPGGAGWGLRSAPCPQRSRRQPEPQPGQRRGDRGASAAAEPGLHPPSQPPQPATAAPAAPCEAGGTLFPFSKVPPTLPAASPGQSRSRCARLPAALPGCLKPATFMASPRAPLQPGGREQEPGVAMGDPRLGAWGYRSREALTGLCLAGCQTWKGCGEGSKRREGPRLCRLFITAELLRDDLGVPLLPGQWGSSSRGALAPGARAQPAETPGSRSGSRSWSEPWDVLWNSQDSAHACLRRRTDHQRLFSRLTRPLISAWSWDELFAACWDVAPAPGVGAGLGGACRGD